MPIKGILLILLIAVIIGIGWRSQIMDWFHNEFEDEETEELKIYHKNEENKE